MFQQILNGAVVFRHADPEAVAPVMQSAPVPAFPTVRIMVNFSVADQIHKAKIGRQVIADISPGVVGPMGRGNGAGPVIPLHALDFTGNHVEGFIPADPFIAGNATVLAIALSVRVEVHTLHRIQNTIGGIDGRLPVLAVGRQGGFAGRRELFAAGFDGPGTGITVVEIDGGGADQFAVLDVNENRAAVGHAGIAFAAVRQINAVFPTDILGQHDRLGEPIGILVRPGHGQVELLLGVDLLLVIHRRHQQTKGDIHILETHADVGIGMNARLGGHMPVFKDKVTPGAFVIDPDLGNEVLLFKPDAECRIPPLRDF